MVAAFFGCSCFLACFGAGIITRPFSASRVRPLPVAVRLREAVSLGPKTEK
jgi:hypothetical protein